MERRDTTVHGFPPIAWNVFLRDRARCQYCRRSGLDDFQIWRELTLDAFLPPDAAGAFESSSLAVCCRSCAERVHDGESTPQSARYPFDPRQALRPAAAYEAFHAMRRMILALDTLRERGLAS